MKTASFFSSVTNPNQFGGKNRKMNVLSSYSLGRNPNQHGGLEDLLSQLQRRYRILAVAIPIKQVEKTKRFFYRCFRYSVVVDD